MSSSRRAQSLDNIRRKKQEKEAGYRQESEYLRMKECSFRPRIRENKGERQAASQLSLQQVAGFQQFYPKVERAQEQARERREVEARLFHLERSYDLRMARAQA